MGINKSKQIYLNTIELQDFADMTCLSLEEVQHLYKIFNVISSSFKDDGVIDPQEFQNALGNFSSQASQVVFNSFDLNKDSVINFREFVIGFSIFMSQNVSYQAKFLFSLLDTDNSHFVTEDKLIHIIMVFLENFPRINLSQQQIISMVHKEFDELFGDQSLVLSNQEIPTFNIQLSQMQLQDEVDYDQKDLSPVKQEKQKIKTDDGWNDWDDFSPLKKFKVPDRTITYGMFRSIVSQNEYILKWLVLDQNKLKQASLNLQKS